jgi:hypothetical protein
MKYRNQTLHLTIQLAVPPTLLENEDTTPIRANTYTRVLIACPDSESPLPTLSSLLPTTKVPASQLMFILPFHSTPHYPTPETLATRRKLYYPPLNPGIPIVEVLKGIAFIEYPTIEVMQQSAWEQAVNGGAAGIVPLREDIGVDRRRDDGWGIKRKVTIDASDENPDGKRPKVEGPGGIGSRAEPLDITGLVAYGSDEDSEEDIVG